MKYSTSVKSCYTVFGLNFHKLFLYEKSKTLQKALLITINTLSKMKSKSGFSIQVLMSNFDLLPTYF